MPDAAVSPATQRPARKKQVAVLVAGFIFLALFVARFVHGDELVDHVPLPYQIAWGAAGMAIGLYFDVKLQDRLKAGGWRGYAGAIVLPLLTIALATYSGRLIFEMVGFAGAAPTEFSVDAPVIDMSSGKSGRFATVTIGSGSREIRVGVTSELYSQLDAYRHPGRDCLVLAVQTGRYGIRRAILPGIFEQAVGVDRLKTCPATVSPPANGADRE